MARFHGIGWPGGGKQNQGWVERTFTIPISAGQLKARKLGPLQSGSRIPVRHRVVLLDEVLR